MFTGIVEETGQVEAVNPSASAIKLMVRANVCARGLKTGDSLAVNGCCLTVEKITRRGKARLLEFALLAETWKRTNLRHAGPGSLVNLERPLRIGDRIGGHFVTGHIDGVGKIIRWERSGKDYVLEISAAPAIMRYVIMKGSIAVDGISLTVATVRRKSFRLWIIPHTRKVTALGERGLGDEVNLEADLVGKYVERLITSKTKI